ncbi:MAG: hypothetical protein O2960_24955 [Verrucomicrobia bacterium]|nr:hypothetical protein [Verrucomicrobiota bacterium]
MRHYVSMTTVAAALCCAQLTNAQSLVVGSFNDSADGWAATWGTNPEVAFDDSLDTEGSNASGSLKVSADYFTPAADGWEQMVVAYTFETPVVGADYLSVSVDVRVDPSSTLTAGNNYGYFEIKRPSNGTPLGGVNLTSTDWTRITFNIPPTEGMLNGVIVQLGSGGFQGPVAYNLDNLSFVKKAGGLAAPTISLERSSVPGLRLFASAPGQAYQRQNIYYVPSADYGNLLWWVFSPDPITYSVTWADFPNKEQYAGFQGHIMLVPDSGGAVSPDWNDPNVIMVEFQYVNTAGPDGANGTDDDVVMARGRFLHKVNEASQNAMLYRTNPADGPVGVLGEIFTASMVGTWSVTFHNSTDVTITAPDNSKLDLTIPDEDAPFYEPVTGGVTALFGVQPNAENRIGQSATISRIQIKRGNTSVVNEDFRSLELDPSSWAARAQDPGGIFTVSPDSAYLISWTLPDTGYALRAGSSVIGPWTDPGITPLQVGIRRMVRFGTSALPGKDTGFFQLIKPSGQ